MWWEIHIYVYSSNAKISFNIRLESGDLKVALENIDVFYFPDNYILTLKTNRITIRNMFL